MNNEFGSNDFFILLLWASLAIYLLLRLFGFSDNKAALLTRSIENWFFIVSVVSLILITIIYS